MLAKLFMGQQIFFAKKEEEVLFCAVGCACGDAFGAASAAVGHSHRPSQTHRPSLSNSPTFHSRLIQRRVAPES